MKHVMKRAWAIAKSAKRKFGGKVLSYMAGALRQAWEEFRAARKTWLGQPLAVASELASSVAVSIGKLASSVIEAVSYHLEPAIISCTTAIVCKTKKAYQGFRARFGQLASPLGQIGGRR